MKNIFEKPPNLGPFARSLRDFRYLPTPFLSPIRSHQLVQHIPYTSFGHHAVPTNIPLGESSQDS